MSFQCNGNMSSRVVFYSADVMVGSMTTTSESLLIMCWMTCLRLSYDRQRLSTVRKIQDSYPLQLLWVPVVLLYTKDSLPHLDLLHSTTDTTQDIPIMRVERQPRVSQE
ncbi:hypothetical protein NP493_482g00017 [Ridgeia piscesae]|uniref:Uncharacterized protein n=1 Tax=Ridgeia piscesae TaxID=27915 RepID=A0AAD9KXV2_RIDPI|nr:hypothetical protein NP493_482g00017 [Ridgeia piscesae]